MPPVLAPRARSCRFGPLEIEWDERVLTPRPWTLAQSRWAVELGAEAGPGPLLELCAGAGHIGLAAAMLADRDLVQVEADPVAAAYSVSNAARAGHGPRVQVRNAGLEQAVRPAERFPLVLADPPYLRSADTVRWPEDPLPAIDGGADGLAITRACLRVAAAHLEPGGALLLQVAGPAQAREVADLVSPVGELRCAEVRVVDEQRAVQLLRRL